MFRLQERMPDAYISNSRDFQLFCRLYEVILNGTKFDIDSIININNADKINERLLQLLAIKEGFFTDYQFDSNTLRCILKSFPHIIKYKGTKQGIRMAVNTILKLENSSESPVINIDESGVIVVAVKLDVIEHRQALEELLQYVLPIGANVQFIYNTRTARRSSQVKSSSVINTMKNNSAYVSSVLKSKSDKAPNIPTDNTSKDINYMQFVHVFNIGDTQVLNSKLYKPTPNDFKNLTDEKYYNKAGDILSNEEKN